MSTGERTYLDYNATAPIRPAAAEACARALGVGGNPSSIHSEGRAARAVVERAREQVAALVGGSPKHVIFTSGGTEAANAVLTPALHRCGEGGADLLLVGAAEHVCVLQGHGFADDQVELVPVDNRGLIRLDLLRARLEQAEGRRVLLSIQAANNETGVIHPVREAAEFVHEHGGLVHSDAVQAAGRIPVDCGALGADVVTLSGHKLGGPDGVGAIVLASEAIELGRPLLRGGGQERGLRAGTENSVAIAGFGAAAEVAAAEREREAARLRGLRERCEAELRRLAPSAVIFGENAERLPNTLCFAIPGLRAETALIGLDLAGIAVSSGSACSSGKVRRSHVLVAMGVEPALAEGAIRVSFGWQSSDEDVIRFVSAFESLLETLYKRRANAA